MPEEWRDPVHNQWVSVLQPGADNKRGRRRRHHQGEREGVEHRVDAHEQELGPELAVQRSARWADHLLQGHRQRPPDLHLLEHRPCQLGVRPDLRRQEFPCLIEK